MFHHLTRGFAFFRPLLTPSCMKRVFAGATIAGTERGNGRLCGSSIRGKQSAGRAAAVSFRQVCAGKGADLQPAYRSIAGRRAGDRLSAARCSRLGGVSDQIFGRGASCRSGCQEGEWKAISHYGRCIFCPDLCARRPVDGALFFFRDRDRRRRGILCGTRARRARLFRRHDLFDRCIEGCAGTISASQD